MTAFSSIFDLGRACVSWTCGESATYINNDGEEIPVTVIVDEVTRREEDRADGIVIVHSLRAQVATASVAAPARGDVLRYDGNDWGFAGDSATGTGYWLGTFTRTEPVNKTRQNRERK